MITAQQVIEAASACEAFADKVFLHKVAEALGVSLPSIAAELVRMHRAGELSLSRCDLVEAFGFNTSIAEVTHLGSQWHFVRLPADGRRQMRRQNKRGLIFIDDPEEITPPSSPRVRELSPRARLEEVAEQHGTSSPEYAIAYKAWMAWRVETGRP